MAGMPMTMVGDAGQGGNTLNQSTVLQPHTSETHTVEQYEDLRRAALGDIDPQQRSRHALVKRKVLGSACCLQMRA